MSKLHEPSKIKPMKPIEGLRFYADALRGDWGSIDGRSEKRSLNEYIDWCLNVGDNTTEADVLEEVELSLNVFVVEERTSGDATYLRGCWSWNVDDELFEARKKKEAIDATTE